MNNVTGYMSRNFPIDDLSNKNGPMSKISFNDSAEIQFHRINGLINALLLIILDRAFLKM